MAWPQNPDLRVGDDARIIQTDTGDWGHSLKVGDVVRLERFDSGDDSWRCTAQHGTPGAWTCWVSQDDLGPGFEPVTDEEVAELFGLKEN